MHVVLAARAWWWGSLILDIGVGIGGGVLLLLLLDQPRQEQMEDFPWESVALHACRKIRRASRRKQGMSFV